MTNAYDHVYWQEAGMLAHIDDLTDTVNVLRHAAQLAVLELTAIHSYYQPKCKGGCPCKEAIEALIQALEKSA